MSTLNIPLLYRRSKRLPKIIVICFLTSTARTTHDANKIPWSQRCSQRGHKAHSEKGIFSKRNEFDPIGEQILSF